MQRSEITGTMRATPNSTAFSIVQSQRDPFVTQAKSVSGNGRTVAQTSGSGASSTPRAAFQR